MVFFYGVSICSIFVCHVDTETRQENACVFKIAITRVESFENLNGGLIGPEGASLVSCLRVRDSLGVAKNDD